MNMIRLLSIPVLLIAIATVGHATETPTDDLKTLAEALLPVQDETAVPSFGSAVASDVASAITDGLLFSFLVFLPFLVIPQILLLVVIFKFRERNDGRKEASFVHNNRLEIAWTAVPILALIIVAIPAMRLLYWQESPPDAINNKESLEIQVTGKQYAWDYAYPEYGTEVGIHTDPGRSGYLQQAMVLEKDRTTHLFLTSNDVNHSWWVPAFGVKKDCFVDRHTHTWFTPTKAGYFEGQCAELCGEGHGIMMITAIVLEKPDFQRWVAFKRFEADARAVITAFRDEGDVDRAVSEYLAISPRHASDIGKQALKFWIIYFDKIEINGRQMAAKKIRDENNKVAWIAKKDTFISQSEARWAKLDYSIKGISDGSIVVPDTPEDLPEDIEVEPTASATAAEEAAQ